MIHYAYYTQLQPPAPFVFVTLRDPVTGAESRDVPAQLDSAADRSVLPLVFVQGLALHVCGQVTVVGFGGTPTQTPLYSVELGVHTKSPGPLRVKAVNPSLGPPPTASLE